MYRRIRDLREDKDMTQKQIAEILSCSQRVYSNYERGELDIPTEILIKLSLFHGVSVDYILGLTDRPERFEWAAEQTICSRIHMQKMLSLSLDLKKYTAKRRKHFIKKKTFSLCWKTKVIIRLSAFSLLKNEL